MSEYLKRGTVMVFRVRQATMRGIVTGIAFDSPELGLYYIVERTDERWRVEECKYPARIVSSDKIVKTIESHTSKRAI